METHGFYLRWYRSGGFRVQIERISEDSWSNQRKDVKAQRPPKSMSKRSATLRSGIIGAGLMGYWHAQAIKRAGGRVCAVVDIDLNAAKRLAARCQARESLSDVSELLNKKGIDVLHICSPLGTHYKIAELGIEAGLSVLVEKPLTAIASETERLFDRAESKGVLLSPVHQFIFQDGVLKAKKLLPQIGSLLHMEANVCSAGGEGGESRRLDEIIADVLPHPLSLFQTFHPQGLLESEWLTMRSRGGEFRALANLSGVTASILISMNGRPTDCSFRLIGTEGTIHLDLFHGYMFVEPGQVSRWRKIIHPFDLAGRRFFAVTTNLLKRVLRTEPAYPGLQSLVKAFYSAVENGHGWPVIKKGDALAVALSRDRLLYPVKGEATASSKVRS